jgi:hypothetical protein
MTTLLFPWAFCLGFMGRVAVSVFANRTASATRPGRCAKHDQATMRGKAEFVNGFSLIGDLVSVFQKKLLT